MVGAAAARAWSAGHHHDYRAIHFHPHLFVDQFRTFLLLDLGRVQFCTFFAV
jgi:hypothetical protein